jgi:hypothetical protein
VFKVGDQVMIYLRKERLPARYHNQLRQKRFGPFKVFKRINANTYVIDLPDNMNISKTFNVADISAYHPEGNLYDHLGASFLQVEENDGEPQDNEELQPNQELQEDGELQPAIINEDFKDFESDL